MTVLVERALVRAGKLVADKVEKEVREHFRMVYEKDGDKRFDALVARLRANIASDSEQDE